MLFKILHEYFPFDSIVQVNNLLSIASSYNLGFADFVIEYEIILK